MRNSCRAPRNCGAIDMVARVKCCLTGPLFSNGSQAAGTFICERCYQGVTPESPTTASGTVRNQPCRDRAHLRYLRKGPASHAENYK